MLSYLFNLSVATAIDLSSVLPKIFIWLNLAIFFTCCFF